MADAADCDEQGYAWSVYPPQVEPELRPGDMVHTLHGRAVVEELVAEGEFAGRVRVVYDEDGSRYHVRPGRLTKVNRGSPQVIVTAETESYRKLARSLPTRADSCVDVGCSYGRCTAVLAAHAGSVLGVDNSKQVVVAARKSYPSIRFECIDAILDRQRLLEAAAGSQLVFLDIGGDRDSDTLVLLIPLLQQLLRPEMVVVKGRNLARAAQAAADRDGRLRNFKPWWADVCGRANDRMMRAGKKLCSVHQGTGKAARRVLHPLQYPRIFLRPGGGVAGPEEPGARAPGGDDNDSSDAGGWQQVCRYHNYLDCKRGARCPHSHDACHCCGAAGHRAVDCVVYATAPQQNGASAPAAVNT